MTGLTSLYRSHQSVTSNWIVLWPVWYQADSPLWCLKVGSQFTCSMRPIAQRCRDWSFPVVSGVESFPQQQSQPLAGMSFYFPRTVLPHYRGRQAGHSFNINNVLTTHSTPDLVWIAITSPWRGVIRPPTGRDWQLTNIRKGDSVRLSAHQMR